MCLNRRQGIVPLTLLQKPEHILLDRIGMEGGGKKRWSFGENFSILIPWISSLYSKQVLFMDLQKSLSSSARNPTELLPRHQWFICQRAKIYSAHLQKGLQVKFKS